MIPIFLYYRILDKLSDDGVSSSVQNSTLYSSLDKASSIPQTILPKDIAQRLSVANRSNEGQIPSAENPGSADTKKKRRISGQVGPGGCNMFDNPRTNPNTPYPGNTDSPSNSATPTLHRLPSSGDFVSSTTSMATSLGGTQNSQQNQSTAPERRPSNTVSSTSSSNDMLLQILNMTDSNTADTSAEPMNVSQASNAQVLGGSNPNTSMASSMALSLAPTNQFAAPQPSLQNISTAEEANIFDELNQVGAYKLLLTKVAIKFQENS